MKSTIQLLLTTILILAFSSQIEAQRLNRMLKDVVDDITEEFSDAFVDKASDKLVELIFGKANQRMDSVYREAYKSDSTYNEKTYADFLMDMDKSAYVADQYNFNQSLEFEMTDHKGKKNTGKYYFQKSGEAMAVQMENQLSIFDPEHDLMVTYDTEEKTGFAVGNVFKFMTVAVVDDLVPEYTIEKTSETKMILGYPTVKYIGTHEDGSFESYVCENFPITWDNAYSALFQQFGNDNIENIYEQMTGMALESTNTDKKGNTNHMKMINYDELTFTVNKSDYKFGVQ